MNTIRIEDSKISFVHHAIGADPTYPRNHSCRFVFPREYHVTVGYQVRAVTTEEKRDPAFIVACGLAFCDDYGPDEFRKSEGRKYATKYLQEHPLLINLYAGQRIMDAIYIALAKRMSSELRALHVPQRLYSLFRGMRKSKNVDTFMHKPPRGEAALHSRRLYNELIAQGKTREEAIEAVRAKTAEHGTK